jgi:hypothetical protein
MAELQEHLATQLATQHRGTYSRPSLNHITTLMCQVCDCTYFYIACENAALALPSLTLWQDGHTGGERTLLWFAHQAFRVYMEYLTFV